MGLNQLLGGKARPDIAYCVYIGKKKLAGPNNLSWISNKLWKEGKCPGEKRLDRRSWVQIPLPAKSQPTVPGEIHRRGHSSSWKAAVLAFASGAGFPPPRDAAASLGCRGRRSCSGPCAGWCRTSLRSDCLKREWCLSFKAARNESATVGKLDRKPNRFNMLDIFF